MDALEAGVLMLTLNRPWRMNALTPHRGAVGSDQRRYVRLRFIRASSNSSASSFTGRGAEEQA
jgi:hypothetical protein